MKIITIITLLITSKLFALDNNELNHYISIIDKAPSWGTMDKETLRSEGEQMLQAFKILSKLPPSSARDVIAKYIKNAAEQANTEGGPTISTTYFKAWTKIYAFNRYYINLPETCTPDAMGKYHSPSIYGGTLHDKEIAPRYPIGKNNELIGEFHAYAGYPYPVISEFDFLIEKFGARNQSINPDH